MPETGSEREKEIYAAQRTLEVYHNIDASLPLGHIPRQQTERLLGLCDGAELLSPGERLEHAWLQTEHFLALLADQHSGNATAKEANDARDTARASFVKLSRNPSVPAQIRAQALVAAPSVALYEKAFLRTPTSTHPPLRSKVAQMEGIHAATRVMLDEFDEPDIPYMQDLTLLTLLAEHTVKGGWYLPAAPRQPWGINCVGYNSRLPSLRLTAGTGQPTEDTLYIPPELFEKHQWPQATMPGFHVLQAYSQFVPGFHSDQTRAPRKEHARLNNIRSYLITSARGVYDEITRHKPPKDLGFGLTSLLRQYEIVNDTTESVDDDLSPIAEWYSSLDANATIEQIGAEEFHKKIQTLQAQATEGILPGRDRHALAWMQRDYAQHLFETAEVPDMEHINSLLDTAIVHCIQATETYKNKQEHGNTCDALFDTESMIVYKAMLNGDPKKTKEAVAAYCRKIANLYMFIRDNRYAVNGNREQMLTLAVCVERITAALLITAATDAEVDHHLALPGRPCASGPGNHIDMMVHTDDIHASSGYTPTNPVMVHFTGGKEITVREGRVFIGRESLGADRMSLFRKLSAISRDKKGKEKRTASIDELCASLATSIVDAHEASFAKN